MTGHYPRALAAKLEQDLARTPVVAVMGARQVGKSTLCRQLAAAHALDSCTLDDHAVREAAVRDPDGLLGSFGPRSVYIDEAQRAPGLLLAIKAAVDRDDRPGRFLLSGSNQPQLGSVVGDSLLGRAVYRTLRPLTLSELRLDETHAGWSFLFEADEAGVLQELERRSERSGALEWQEVVRTGGFPRAVLSLPGLRLPLLNDYVEAFARRDIRELIGIDASDRFESFFRLSATRLAQPLNYSGLAQDLGVPVNTIRRWTDALRRSYLVELFPAYSRNAGQRFIKAPKLVVVDTALALAASREVAPSGFHLENLVATDLATWRDGDYTRAVYHWRLASGQEVDLVAEEKGRIVAVEIKTAKSVTLADAKHLLTFLDRHDEARRAILLYGGATIRVIARRVITAPWWAVL